MKNKLVRKALIDAEMTQTDLGQILGITQSTVSGILKFELAHEEQEHIVQLIMNRKGS